MGALKPKDSWYGHFRRRADRRSFYIACGVSAALHLSTVTLFSIVIHFPRQDIQFHDFAIIPVEVHPSAAEDVEAIPPAGDSLPGPDQLALRGPGNLESFRDIQLPTLEFAELERLRVRQESLQSLSRFDDMFQEPADDSWSRFSRGLAGLSRSLSELRLSRGGSDSEGNPLPPGTAEAPRPAHRPAEGFEAYIVWAGEPDDRKLLFAPPVEALWSVDPAALRQPIEVVLQVNALGKVVNVLSPNVDARALVDAVQMSALQYRFEPLTLGEGDMQMATLRIQREQPERAP